jgi:hypothetical protein
VVWLNLVALHELRPAKRPLLDDPPWPASVRYAVRLALLMDAPASLLDLPVIAA